MNGTVANVNNVEKPERRDIIGQMIVRNALAVAKPEKLMYTTGQKIVRNVQNVEKSAKISTL